MNQNRKLRVGIAGYGIVGKRRRVHIDQHPCLQTVAVCDQVFDRDSDLGDGVNCFREYSQLLTENLDVLLVSLPNYLAPEVTIAGLRKGLHVFCEKPPGRNLADVIAVMKAKDACPQTVLKYGFNHRYHHSVQEALRLVRSGELGDIINMRGLYGKSKIVPFDGNWRSSREYAGGGILLDQGIHLVDLMRLFCGDFSEIKSFVSNGFWGRDVEDNAYALMRDQRGRVAILHSSATQWQHRFSLEINLSGGYLEMQGILSGTKSYGEEKLLVGKRNNSSTGSDKVETTTYLEDNSWRDEINEFADAIINDTPIVSGTVEDAYQTMKVVYQIYQADPVWRGQYNL
jgi:predicted dehydrogenase